MGWFADLIVDITGWSSKHKGKKPKGLRGKWTFESADGKTSKSFYGMSYDDAKRELQRHVVNENKKGRKTPPNWRLKP